MNMQQFVCGGAFGLFAMIIAFLAFAHQHSGGGRSGKRGGFTNGEVYPEPPEPSGQTVKVQREEAARAYQAEVSAQVAQLMLAETARVRHELGKVAPGWRSESYRYNVDARGLPIPPRIDEPVSLDGR
jgi:hypothetical protein